MGIAGGAILPRIYAQLEHSMGTQSAFFLSMLPCYLYILYYARAGHRTTARKHDVEPAAYPQEEVVA